MQDSLRDLTPLRETGYGEDLPSPHSYLVEACKRPIRSPGAVTLPLPGGAIQRA